MATANLPQALKSQFNICREATQALNVPCISLEGYEADDLIAAYSRKAKAAGHMVTIVSGDKDLMQLCDDSVRVFDFTKEKYVGVEEVQAKFGVPPRLIPDLLALTGDDVDNVKGVPGFGPKTAASLIQEFGGIEGLLSNVQKVEPVSRRERVKSFTASILSDLQLLRLRDDVELPVALEKLAAKPFEEKKLFPFLEAQHFLSIMNQLKGALSMEGETNAARKKSKKQKEAEDALRPPPIEPKDRPVVSVTQ